MEYTQNKPGYNIAPALYVILMVVVYTIALAV